MFKIESTKPITKRNLLQFIFLLSLVFVLSISCPFVVDTSAQEPSLAEKVFEKYRTFFQREDIKEILPTALDVLKQPEPQKIINPETIDLIVRNPDLLKTYVDSIDDDFITLLKEDQEIQDFLRDTDVQTLLQDVAAIEELETLLMENLVSLAEKIHERYLDLFMREDIQAQLPILLIELKDPEIQKLLIPETIQLVIDKPDLLKTFLPDIDDEIIRLLKEDSEIIAFISDPDVQLLLQDPEAIDELEMLLSVPVPVVVTVKIVPASIVSPMVGEQLIITVDIADGVGLAGYQGTINFDPLALQFVALEHGTYLSGNLLPIATVVENNQISFAQISIDTTATTEEGTLVTITFEVLDAKASMLSLSDVIISGLAGVEHQVIVENAEILEPPKTPWDVNNDGRVNILDLTFVASHFGEDNPPPAADVNGDGKVNILDLTTVASHFGETT